VILLVVNQALGRLVSLKYPVQLVLLLSKICSQDIYWRFIPIQILMRYLIILLLCSITMAPLLAQPERNVSILDRFQADQVFREGLDLYNSNKMGAALTKFMEVIRLNPKHPDVHELLGEIYYLEGDYQQAYQSFKKASKMHPENPKLKNDLGVAAASSGAYLTAVGHFEEALDLDPGYRDASVNLEEAQKRQQGVASGLSKGEGVEISDKYPDESKFVSTDAPVDPISEYQSSSPSNQNRRNPGRSYDYSGLDLKVGGQTDENIDVVAVKVTSSRTIVTFRIKNPNRRVFEYRVAPPNSEDAWFLVDAQGKKSYRLQGFLNQPEIGRKKPIKVRYGREYLTAYFERLDPEVFEFNILEGKMPVPGAWNFYYVKLDKDMDQ
jgi:tetratricopeptide (TPR) repeat protein